MYTIVDKDVSYFVNGESVIQEDVLQLEYNRELRDTIDIVQYLGTIALEPEDVSNEVNDFIINNRNLKEVTVD